ncbi:hypothetical protein P3W85_28585 [Cupriavidus basilensis]|uniref:Uncharacterized protein n=1 Tax=Cupriavidus basilensis TaxID=68895 RepID=A0ABT6AXA4_9BURK|nr:hypothetical protein [Cupriavidus basilensis]MDF3836877.1 hypothetical protein [Cupriavidus basilensis]
MWRRSLALLLSAFLLFGQAAGAIHSLSHLHAQPAENPCAAPADTEQCGPGHDACLQCLAFAAAAVAIPALACCWLVLASGRRWHYPLLAERHVCPVFSPPPRSRGPPLASGLPA